MKKFLQFAKKMLSPSTNSNFELTYDCFGRYYSSMDYNMVKDFGGMKLMTEILRLTNDAVKRQRSLIYDTNLLVEKVLAKIEWKEILVNYKISHQILYDQYSLVLLTSGLWPMLLEKFVNYDVVITEQEFRPVAGMFMKYLENMSIKEKTYISQLANSCIHSREDGRLEIIFPGKLWGGKEVVENTLRLAEEKGMCIIETNTSPISQKVVLPYNWSISEYSDNEGYLFILNDLGEKVAFFRITSLPNSLDNGEIDFFMVDEVDKLSKYTPKLNIKRNSIGSSFQKTSLLEKL